LWYVGQTIGSLSFGTVSDNFGRKPAILGGSVGYLLFGVTAALSPNWWVFAILKTLSGIFMRWASLAGIMYISEVVGVKYRTVLTCLWYIWYSVLIGLLSAYAYLSDTWQALQLSISLSIIPALISLPWFYESPRYLLVSGNAEKAEECLQLIAKHNKKEIKGPVISEKLIQNVAEDTQTATKYTILDLFRNGREIWSITIRESYIGFVTFLCYIGVHLNVQSLPGDVYVNHAIYGLVEVPAAILGLILMERKALGRTRTTCISLTICALCYVILGYFTTIKDACVETEDWLANVTLALAIVSKCSSQRRFVQFSLKPQNCFQLKYVHLAGDCAQQA